MVVWTTSLAVVALAGASVAIVVVVVGLVLSATGKLLSDATELISSIIGSGSAVVGLAGDSVDVDKAILVLLLLFLNGVPITAPRTSPTPPRNGGGIKFTDPSKIPLIFPVAVPLRISWRPPK